MNFLEPNSASELFALATSNGLYQKLIEQINKDFALANESLDAPLSVTPIDLTTLVANKIYRLIQYKFAEYLNLLYIVDVPENAIKNIDGSDIDELSKQVSLLVLKREWMKVWYRNNY